MYFYADLHIHSKYALATSKNADLENMALWALKKGISVVGTGDFTHPLWFETLKEKLVPAEQGLFRLRPDIEQQLPKTPQNSLPRFLLQVEISTIYKKNNAVRKIHHLIYVPDFQAAQTLIQKLARIGNLNADGRPILGIDSRNLLEITLETSPYSYLIPAHIWTPWFAVLGSRSGFDSLYECYDDLTPHIFAVETGLSSDPPMNWQVSQLHPYTLVSNSDAHSPPKIGREATIFHTQKNYHSLFHALKTGQGYIGTIEFFPEEGKYHLDGHRHCNIRLSPQQSKEYNHLCPECGEKLTLGVLYRVQQLADQKSTPPVNAGKVVNLIPLNEIIAEILQTQPNTKKVNLVYQQLLNNLGTELDILQNIPLEDLPHPLFVEAISRLRSGHVHCQPGYDGEYGTIKLFQNHELQQPSQSHTLFQDLQTHTPTQQKKTHTPKSKKTHIPPIPIPNNTTNNNQNTTTTQQLDTVQQSALSVIDKPLLILAGPGSGKTRTLTHWLLNLISQHNIPPSRLLAITFTRRAAHELQQRLQPTTNPTPQNIHIHTFHSLSLFLIQNYHHLLPSTILNHLLNIPNTNPQHNNLNLTNFNIPTTTQRTQLLIQKLHISEKKAQKILSSISITKRENTTPTQPQDLKIYNTYQQIMYDQNWLDYDDLILLASHIVPQLPQTLFNYIAVDEFQDIDTSQYLLLQNLITQTQSVCVIGDPHQSIYSFRGANPQSFQRFQNDYPNTQTLNLNHNYRSTQTIISVSQQILKLPNTQTTHINKTEHEYPIILHTSETENAEAEYVVHTIEQLLAGHNLFSIDTQRTTSHTQTHLSFNDIAILYRTDKVSVPVINALERSGIPYYKYDNTPLIQHPDIQAILPSITQLNTQNLNSIIPQITHNTQDQRIPPYISQLAQNCNNDLHLFLRTLEISTVSDLWDPRAEKIPLLTIHAAKGLEFPVVFIVGVEDGIIPLFWGQPNTQKQKEELRLLYVAITRTQQCLFITHSRSRIWNGKKQKQKISPFLQLINKNLCQESYLPRLKKTPIPKQLPLF